LSVARRIVYLHGFASSPHSHKATVLGQNFRARGFQVDVPQLDGGDFPHLTITSQLDVIDAVVSDDPVTLIGSSLGGYLAALFAARHRQVEKLILLAPAFDFHRLWESQLGPERIFAWRESGSIGVFHYGAEREVPLGYDLMNDAARYEGFPEFSQPALIFHGDRDPLVPIELSEKFAATHPNAKLISLSSGHELTDVLDRIWHHSKDFLGDAQDKNRC
jgi:pimeloyl-ACP methyl ester carboxylesterase